MGKISDSAYLVREAIARLGNNENPDKIAAEVRRLEIGLPLEDEFQVICQWFSQCNFIHKLDQNDPINQKTEEFQVPDLLASFTVKGKIVPVLIEVKTKQKQRLKFKESYFQRLVKYSENLGIPLLIAFKWQNLWCLFDASEMQLRETSRSIGFLDAMKFNLMGVLVGDFSFSVHKGFGLHLEADKKDLISVQEDEAERVEDWNLQISRFYYTNKEGDEVSDLPSAVQELIKLVPLSESTNIEKEKVTISYTVTEDQMELGHRALVSLLAWSSRGGKLNWRSILKDPKNKAKLFDLRKAVDLGLKHGVVRICLHQIPDPVPKFLDAII